MRTALDSAGHPRVGLLAIAVCIVWSDGKNSLVEIEVEKFQLKDTKSKLINLQINLKEKQEETAQLQALNAKQVDYTLPCSSLSLIILCSFTHPDPDS